MPPRPSVHVGDCFEVSDGVVSVVEYNGANSIDVVFEDGTIVKTRADHLKAGVLLNPYKPSVSGLGFVGVGKHRSCGSKVYKVWAEMLSRCYNSDRWKNNPTYADCTVHIYWHNFQNFAEWYSVNSLIAKVALDKDLLIKGNREYGPDTCSLLPRELNNLLIRKCSDRGDLPIGVHLHKQSGKYYAGCSVGKTSAWLGSYSNPISAFNAYKTFKEAYIKQQAVKWKDMIDPRAYEALMNYEVLITD